jgi:hypothetical protein
MPNIATVLMYVLVGAVIALVVCHSVREGIAGKKPSWAFGERAILK